jgi:hypothetical protein
MLNGTINKSSLNIMEDSTFTDWTEKIKEEAEKIDVIINFTIRDLNIFQKNSWKVTIGLNITLNVNDKRGTASWNINKFLETNVNIEGLEDPLYIINSYGRVPNVVRKSNITDFDILSNLIKQINNSYYIESDTAPNFLMRFENNLSNSTYGIESLVNLDKFTQQGLQIYSRSNVDYIYFGNQSVSSCIINETYEDGTFDWFRLDNDIEPYYHLDNYGDVKCR